MAAAITTASTTLEGQLLEVAMAMQALEAATANSPTPLNNVQVVADIEGGSLSITASLPATVTQTGAALSLSPTPYL